MFKKVNFERIYGGEKGTGDILKSGEFNGC